MNETCGGDRKMEHLTKEDVKHVAHLARLAVTDEETEKYQTELNELIDLAKKLQEVDTEGIAPTSHTLYVENVFRNDERRPSPDRNEALKNAPDHQDGQFKVPSVLE